MSGLFEGVPPAATPQVDPIIAIERNILASLMMSENPKTSLKAIDELLNGYSWKDKRNVLAFGAWKTVAKRDNVADAPAVMVELSATNSLMEAGGTEYLADCIEKCADVNALERWIADIIRLSSRAKAIKIAGAIQSSLAQGKPVEEEIDRLAVTALHAGAGQAPIEFEELVESKALGAEELLPLIAGEVPYLIRPILIQGCLTQIHGAPKGGKSVFSLFLSVAASTGIWPKQDLIFGAEPVKTLYISWEDSAFLIGRRIVEYTAGLGMGNRVIPANLRVIESPFLFLSDKSHGDALEAYIKKHEYRFIVLDTLSYAHAADEDRASEMKPVMARLKSIARRTSSAIMYVHHRRKSSSELPSAEKSRGSTAIPAAADILIDWGDRGNGNTTPCDVRTKYGYSRKWDVEYMPDDNGPVRWDIRLRHTDKLEDRVGTTYGVFLDLSKTSPAGVAGATIVGALAYRGYSKSSCYRYLTQLEEQGKLVHFTHASQVYYKRADGPPGQLPLIPQGGS